MRHCLADLNAFQLDPLKFLLDRGNGADEALVPLAIGNDPFFLVADPAVARRILKFDTRLIDKGRLVRKLRPLIGDSFLSSNGTGHIKRREVMHRQLARGVAQKYVPTMSAVIRQMATQLTIKDRIDVHQVTAHLALSMACIAMFGHEVLTSGDRQALVGALKLVEDEIADEMFRVRPLAPWSHLARWRRRRLARSTMSFVVSRVRQNAGASSLAHALEQLDLSDRQIRDEILTMLVAGHHTTGTAAAWLFYHLAQNPKLADRIAQEAKDLGADDGDIDPKKLKDARTTLAVVQEVLRLYPSAWWFAREVKKPVELGGRNLKPGTSLLVSPWQLHRNPKYWVSPDQFDIERSFSGPAYMPFGAGPRACVGMGLALLELQLLALEFCSAFHLSNVSPAVAPWPKASVTLIPPAIELSLAVRMAGAPTQAVS